ncbi:hypothetical protein C8R45DRAFT_640495 [Mycena sanguinolenta]|nr:hypothetical protein C8R45DRAFT_640495 [Mycena sanguinolenta]
MPNGWTRFDSNDVVDCEISLFAALYPGDVWLNQANHIFRRLRIISGFEDYVYLDSIKFRLMVSDTTVRPPLGFLFLCPGRDFRIGASYCWPACVAYWSLDSSGVDRLSPENATSLGFPAFELSATAFGCSWGASVYEGLRQFHQAKGFDPYSQDVARHMDYRLYQLSYQAEPPFAHVRSDGDDIVHIKPNGNLTYTTNCESEYPLILSCEDLEIIDVDIESYHNKQDVLDAIIGDCGSEHTKIANYACEKAVQDTVYEEVSITFRTVIAIQLVLIFFVALCWVYEHVCQVQIPSDSAFRNYAENVK